MSMSPVPFHPKNGKKLRVLVIARVSDLKKQDKRSWDDQRAFCEPYIAERYSGQKDIELIKDSGSGEYLDRSEYLRAIAAIEAGKYDVVICEDLGRILRRAQAILFCELCEDCETRFIAINDMVRSLGDGETVQHKGHHVVWIPKEEGSELAIGLRILDQLRTMPASRLARLLTSEGVPSPYAGRKRTDNGVIHLVSGVWHATSIMNIARNPLWCAVKTYNFRSRGDQLRASLNGPRQLEESDYRSDGKPKVIRNKVTDVVSAPAHHKPLVELDEFRTLQAILDKRAGTQRGKPRSRDPNNNPMGGRIFDMNCGWLLYRQTYGKSFKYVCGAYMQSHGASCSHNNVDGPTAARFVKACVNQKLATAEQMSKLQDRISQLLKSELSLSNTDAACGKSNAELESLNGELATIKANMARAKTAEQFKVISEEYDLLESRIASLRKKSEALQSRTQIRSGFDREIDSAMDLFHRIRQISETNCDNALLAKLFAEINARLFLRFKEVKLKKRTVTRIDGGEVTLGDKPSPVKLYEGPTGRKNLVLVTSSKGGRDSMRSETDQPKGQEDKSLGNVNSGEWI